VKHVSKELTDDHGVSIHVHVHDRPPERAEGDDLCRIAQEIKDETLHVGVPD